MCFDLDSRLGSSPCKFEALAQAATSSEKIRRKMAWMHAFDTDAPASSPYDRFKDSLRVVGHCASHGLHTARPNQMLLDVPGTLSSRSKVAVG